MERLLKQFIGTLEASLKTLQDQAGVSAGFARLTLAQIRYIEAIHSLGEPAVSEIAHHMRLSKASVTAGVDRLVALGYASKRQSSEDKRVFHVSLTTEAQKLIRAREETLRSYGAFIRSALTDSEAEQFEIILTKLVNVFTERKTNG